MTNALCSNAQRGPQATQREWPGRSRKIRGAFLLGNSGSASCRIFRGVVREDRSNKRSVRSERRRWKER